MKTVLFVATAASAVAASADAGFLGFVASYRNVGAYTVVDVFAGVSNSSDKFLSVYDSAISTAGGFYQQAGLATKAWKPDTAGFTSTRDSIDSFMTAGTYTGGAYGGVFYASTNSNGDPNFTGTTGAWNATPGSAPATTIPALAGWFTGDPPSVDNTAESLAGLAGRIDLSGGAAATHGIWVAHLVVSGNDASINWAAYGSVKDGVTSNISSALSSGVIPAPGAIALLGAAGLASRRRRA